MHIAVSLSQFIDVNFVYNWDDNSKYNNMISNKNVEIGKCEKK